MMHKSGIPTVMVGLLLVLSVLSSLSFAQNQDQALMEAAKKGNLKNVQDLLSRGADVNAKAGRDGFTPLLNASFYGKLDVTELLLEQGADVNSKDNYGKTALWHASSQGYLEIAKHLLAKGADVNANTRFDGETPLMKASSQGHLDVMRLLLENGADINAQRRNGDTALIMSCHKGLLDATKILTKTSAGSSNEDLLVLMVRFENRLRETMASYDGHSEIVGLLLSWKPDVNITNKLGLTALGIATLQGQDRVVDLLRNNGAVELGHGYRNEAFITAAKRNDMEQVKDLLAQGADVNFRDEEGFTILMWVVFMGQYDVVKQLVEKGADVNARTGLGANSLTFACRKDSDLEIVKLLLDKGADPNAKFLDGTTVLMVAVEEGSLDIVQLLLDKGVNVNAKTSRGLSALNIAAEKGHTPIVDLLKARGANE